MKQMENKVARNKNHVEKEVKNFKSYTNALKVPITKADEPT